MAKALRTIFVKRDDPDSKMKAAQEIQRRASSGGVWPKVLLVPEGMCVVVAMIDPYQTVVVKCFRNYPQQEGPPLLQERCFPA